MNKISLSRGFWRNYTPRNVGQNPLFETSSDVLSHLADEALEEYKAKKTQNLNVYFLQGGELVLKPLLEDADIGVRTQSQVHSQSSQ